MSAKMSGLGRGMDALLPTDFDASILIEKDERVQNLSISIVHPNPDQPRKYFDEQALKELSASIKRYGVLQPLIVVPTDDSSYEIVAGERRWRAAQAAGLNKVPAIIRKRQELEQLEIALIENVQRVDLSPLEQAISIEKLHQQFNMSYVEIADRLGKAATTVNNIVRLLQLPELARAALQENKITEGHARAILALKGSPDKQKELLQKIIDHDWSVRQAEQFVTSHKQGVHDSVSIQNRLAPTTPETQKLGKYLGTKVTLKHTAKGGRLEIHYKSDEELNDLIEKISRQ